MAWSKKEQSEGGKAIKGNQIRDKVISLRISQEELDLLDAICKKKKDKGKRWSSRTDVIVLALKHVNEQWMY